MSTYNGERFLREQLDSIFSQEKVHVKLIVRDDGSSDRTLDILREYQAAHRDMLIISDGNNMRACASFLYLIRTYTDDNYFALADQDDIWVTDKIEIQVKSIGDSWLSSGFSKPFASGENIKIHFDSRLPNCTLERMVYVGMTPGHTMLIKKELLDRIPDLNAWIDSYTYDKLLQIVAASYEKVQFCNKILVHNRRHINAATYGPAENYQRTLSNIFYSMSRTYSLYKELRPFMREYFSYTFKFLSSISAHTISKENAMKMAYYQSQKSLWAYLRLTIICIQVRNKIFHTKENNPIIAVLRAIYFPISCCDYFRYKSSKYMKK